jgi:hypothetical protein
LTRPRRRPHSDGGAGVRFSARSAARAQLGLAFGLFRAPKEETGMTATRAILAAAGLGAVALAACAPTVRVEVPDKPIEINLNVNMKIEQEVRVRLDREIESAITQNPGIF